MLTEESAKTCRGGAVEAKRELHLVPYERADPALLNALVGQKRARVKRPGDSTEQGRRRISFDSCDPSSQSVWKWYRLCGTRPVQYDNEYERFY